MPVDTPTLPTNEFPRGQQTTMDNDNEMQVTSDPDKPATKSFLSRGLAIGLAAGLVGGAAAGFVFGVPGLSSAESPSVVEQTADTTPGDSTPADSTPADSAPDDTTTDADSGTRLRDALQPLVDDGTITAAQADAVVAQLKKSIPEHGGRIGPGGGRHRGGGEFGHILSEASDVVTGVLGIDATTLRTDLMAGKSLADIATENGVDPQAVIDALVAEAQVEIDQAVTDGRIDVDRATQLEADLESHLTDLVNGSLGDFGDFGGHDHHSGGHTESPDDDSPEAPGSAPTSTDAPVTTEAPVTTGN